MNANFMHRKEIYYINIHIDIQCLTYLQILHFPNITFLKGTRIQSSFRIFLVASFSLLTASSTASSTILIVSNAAFMARSLSGSYCGGDSSTEVK
jgi:predicted ATP-grasp superfamily ATP-dependent carboligase